MGLLQDIASKDTSRKPSLDSKRQKIDNALNNFKNIVQSVPLAEHNEAYYNHISDAETLLKKISEIRADRQIPLLFQEKRFYPII